MKASEDYRTGLQWSKQKKYNLRNSQVWTNIEKRCHSKDKNSVIFISLTNIGYTYPFNKYYWHFVLNRNALYLVNRLKSRIRHPRHPFNKTFFHQITSHRAAEWQNRTTSNVDPRWRNAEPVSEMLGQRLVSFWGVQDIPIVPLNGFKFFQWQVFWIPVNCAQFPDCSRRVLPILPLLQIDSVFFMFIVSLRMHSCKGNCEMWRFFVRRLTLIQRWNIFV